MSKLFIIITQLCATNIVQGGLGAANRNAQDASNQNSLASIQSNSASNQMFNRQTEADSSHLIEANAQASNVMGSIIKQRIAESQKQGLVKVSKNATPEDIAASCGVVIVIGLIMVLVFWGFRSLRKYVESHLLYSQNNIARDMLFIIFFITIFYILSMYNVIDEVRKYVDVEGVTVFMLMSIFLWSLLGIYKIFYLQSELNWYDYYEANFMYRKEVLEEYTDLINKSKEEGFDRKDKKRLDYLRNQIRYYIFKTDFINPEYLPTVGETYFTEDFPFSEYIGLCFGKTMRKYLQFKLNSYLLALQIILVTISYSNSTNEIILTSMLTAIPTQILVMTLYCKRRINEIYKLCYPNEKEGEMVIFTNLNPQKAKGFNLNCYPELMKEKYPKKTPNSIYLSNKQEMLFPFKDPKFLLSMVQLSEISQIVFIAINAPCLCNIDCDYALVYVISIAVYWGLISVIIFFFVTPEILVKYSFASKTVMLRDYKLASIAIQNHKERLKDSYKKFYRGIKMMNRLVDWRLKSWFVKKSVKTIHKNFINNAFKILQDKTDDNAKRIPIKNVKDLGHLFGHKLETDEILALSKESINVSESPDHIDIELFMAYVATLTEEAKYDPYNCIMDCMNHYKLVDNDKMVNLIELQNFMLKYCSIDQFDVDNVIFDLSLLDKKSDRKQVNIDSMASYIRNNIEGFAR